MATARAPLLVLDAELRVQTANRAFYDVFATSPAETEGRRLFDLGTGQWNIPALRRLLEEVLPQDQVITDLEVEHASQARGRAR